MGTSTHNGGQKGGTPLVPSWLEQPDVNPQNENGLGPDGSQIPPVGDVDRFRTPRGEFTRYINSGGRDSSLGRKSVSNYIRNSLGGSSNATQRMGAARSSSARLLNVAGVFASGGARAVEQYLSIENLSHKTASDAFIAITDFICPDGGPQDEGIARSAYISAIEESPEIATIKFEDLTSEQIMVIVERTMANAIFNRITNDIGNKIILLPQERAISDRLIVQMKDFVKGSVSDAVINLDIKAGNIRQDWYQKSWRLDIQNMSWVEDTNRQVDFLIKQLQLKGTEKILDLACEFGRHSLEFARRGYDVTGMERVKEYEMPEGNMEEVRKGYQAAALDKIKEFTKVQFLHWTKEEFPCCFRKMLTLEQYRDPELAKLYQQYLSGGPLLYIEEVFRGFTDNEGEARQLALDFYGPIFLLYSIYDGIEDKESIIEQVEQHVERFSKMLLEKERTGMI